MKAILFSVSLLSIIIPSNSIAQERIELWTRANIKYENIWKENVLLVEFQYRDQYLTRFQEINQKTYSFRPWITGKFGRSNFYFQSSPVAFFYRSTHVNKEGLDLNEFRSSQNFGYKFKFPIDYRMGMEWRSFSNEFKRNEWRLRTRIQSLMLKDWIFNPVLSIEYLYRIYKKESGFDQLRMVSGIRKSWTGIETEIGYQYHLRQTILNQKSHSNIIYINLTPKI